MSGNTKVGLIPSACLFWVFWAFSFLTMFSSITKSFQFIFPRNLASPSLNLTRAYAIKTDLKTRWVRPEKISSTLPQKSGDLVGYEAPEQQRFIHKFDKSEELKTADEMVKRIFSLDQNRRGASVRIYRNEMIERVKRHNHDLGSYEVFIAKMTATIRAMQEHQTRFPRNKPLKVVLKELIDKRKKYLRILRIWDYKKFEWLIQKLDLVYKPYPEHFHWITRKDSLRKLAKIQCDNTRQERLDKYRKELQSQQLGFLENKIKNLEFIRNEQIECKVPVTVPLEAISDAKKAYEDLKLQRFEEEELNKKQIAKDDYELNL